jgi:hypothetical protein
LTIQVVEIAVPWHNSRFPHKGASAHARVSDHAGRGPRGPLRMTRGRCGSLLLHRKGLAPSTPCRSPGASQRVTPENRPSPAALAARVTGDPLPLPVRTVTRVSPSQSPNRMTLTRSPSAIGKRIAPVGPVGLGWRPGAIASLTPLKHNTRSVDAGTVLSWLACKQRWPTSQ